MEIKNLVLKILLPHSVFVAIDNVSSLVFETNQGMLGMLPNRLDCVGVVVPGILSYVVPDAPKQYVALDRGIFVKVGPLVTISVRQAIGSRSLAELHATVEAEFRNLDEQEKSIRMTIAKLESGFMHRFQQLQDV